MSVRSKFWIVGACLVLSLLPGRALGQAGGDGAVDLERMRARWESLAPEERARMRERYERFKGLSREEREKLVGRAERLRGIADRARGNLTPQMRAELERLSPAKRRELLGEITAAEAREVGQRIFGKLPADVRRRLEGVDTAERERILTEFQASRMERLELVARRLGLDAGEMERVRELPAKERRRRVLELLRERIEQRIEEVGLPAGFPVERWQALDVLSPEEFFAAFMRLRQSDPRIGRAVMPDRDGAPYDPGRERLRDALRADPADRIGLSGLAAPERARELLRRRRERAFETIRAEGMLAPERLAELEKVSDPKFFRIARKLALGAGSERVLPRGAPGARRDAFDGEL